MTKLLIGILILLIIPAVFYLSNAVADYVLDGGLAKDLGRNVKQFGEARDE